MSFSTFDWASEAAIPEQSATAIYKDDKGNLIVRQQNEDGDDDVVIISRANISEFVANVQRVAKEVQP